MTYKYTADKQYTVKTGIKNIEFTHQYFSLDKSGLLTINKGYSWNGMSYYPDSKSTFLASMYHDCLYQIISLNLLDYKYKKDADNLMLFALVRDGHPEVFSFIAYMGVSIFGGFFISNK